MLLLLDIDGVLLQAGPDFRESMLLDTGWKGDDQSFFEKLFKCEEYLATLEGRRDFEDFIDSFIALNGSPCEVKSFMRWWCHPLSPNLDLIRCVRKFTSSKVGLASNQEKYRAAAILNGLIPYLPVDYVFLSFELGAAKPSRSFFEQVLSQSGYAPHEVTFVDDSAANVEVAMEMGINSVLFHENRQTIGALERTCV